MAISDKKVSKHRKEHDSLAKDRLLGLAEELYDQFVDEIVPNVNMPSRTKNNIEYSDKSDVWVYGDRTSIRSAKTVKGAFQLLKTAYTVDFLVKNHIAYNRGSTLRELYYISENWDIAKFREQPESDRLIEDLEIISNLQREYFHMRPEEDGATMFGPIRIREQTKRGQRTIHCQEDIGESGYQMPFNV